MTTEELSSYFNRIFGIEKEWPKTFEVDADTYANCCQAIFNDFQMKIDEYNIKENPNTISQPINRLILSIYVGPNCGLLFKGVELILVRSR